MKPFFDAWKKYADFSGRASLAQYWWFFGVNVVIASALALADRALGIVTETGPAMLLGLYGLYCVAALVPSLAVTVRRLHDTGRSGRWALIALIPGGALVLLVLLLLPSHKSENAYDGASRSQHDPFGAFAYAMYVLVGGFLVFGYAWSLRGAVETERESACRALVPEEGREGEAPPFEVQDLAGNRVTLEDFAGKFVILNFWATWCEPCITEWPQVHRLAERLSDRDDVVVVAISIDSDRPLIEPFLARMSLLDTPVTVLWDPQQNVHEAFGTEKIPDTYFVGPDGRVVHTFVNTRKWGTPDAFHCVSKTADRHLR